MKFAIIGLDGADPNLIKNWDMPNLKKIMKEGSHGKYRSVLPPVTAPAWSSIITGKDPSWHGLMHFTDTDPFHGKKQLVNSRSIKCKKIWQILNEGGLSCGIYMVPVTYPVEKINGFMFSGMLSPEYSETYPPMDIKVKPFVNWNYVHDRNLFYTKLVENTDRKFTVLREMIKQHPVDFLFMVESNTDSVQHLFFHGEGPTDARQKAVARFFNFVDLKIGELLEIIDCPVLFVSDHGFGKLATKYVNVNLWLHEKGLLEYNEDKIDWDHTKTYFYNAWLNCGFIKNNINNIDNISNINNINNIAKDLKKEGWVEEVYLLKEIYTGPFAKDMPEICFIFSEEYTGNKKVGRFDTIHTIPDSFRYVGHRMDGFWACSEKIEMKTLMDVAPTVLKLMGQEDAVSELGDPIEYISEQTKNTIRLKKI